MISTPQQSLQTYMTLPTTPHQMTTQPVSQTWSTQQSSVETVSTSMPSTSLTSQDKILSTQTTTTTTTRDTMTEKTQPTISNNERASSIDTPLAAAVKGVEDALAAKNQLESLRTQIKLMRTDASTQTARRELSPKTRTPRTRREPVWLSASDLVQMLRRKRLLHAISRR